MTADQDRDAPKGLACAVRSQGDRTVDRECAKFVNDELLVCRHGQVSDDGRVLSLPRVNRYRQLASALGIEVSP